MNRRTSLAALSALATHALFPRVLEAWAQTSARPAAAAWQPRAIGARGPQLAALVDAILPDTDTPGARAAGVHVFIDLIVADCLPDDERKAFLDGFAALDAACVTAHGAGLDAATPAAVTELLRQGEAAATPFVKQLKTLTVLGYGASELGATKAFAYDPVPGVYRGCTELAPGQRAWAEAR